MTMTSLRFALVLMATTGFVDAYTFVERGGVFANAQTGNVILGAIAVSTGSWLQAFQHLASILVFSVGVLVATHLRATTPHHELRRPGLVALTLYAVMLGAAAFVPSTARPLIVVVPITLAAGLMFALFRRVDEFTYAPMLTTGNLTRWLEAGHAHLYHPSPTSRHTFNVFFALTMCFVAGALAGALVTDAVGPPASAFPASAVLLTTLLVARGERRASEQAQG
jgi:uncharacterized membrane protein YoaK (UPF0700 family)